MKTFGEIKDWKQNLMSALSFAAKVIMWLFKWSWRVCSIALAVIIILVAYTLLTDNKSYHKISPQYEIYKYSTLKKYRIKDCYRDKWVSGWLDSIDREFGSDSLIRFSRSGIFGRNHLYGYIDANTGKVAIKPQFYFAGRFSEGVAAVRKAGKIGFIDTNGEFVVTVNKWVSNLGDIKMSGGYAIIDIDHQNSYGILSRSGEWMLEPKWDQIKEVEHGLFIVSGGGYDGLWSSTKGWIYSLEHDSITIAGGRDQLLTITKDGWCWQIDYSGNVVNDFVFDHMVNVPYNKIGESTDTPTTSAFAIFYIGDYAGLFDLRTNKAVTPAIYSKINMITPNLLEVSTNDGESFLIDSNGKALRGIR